MLFAVNTSELCRNTIPVLCLYYWFDLYLSSAKIEIKSSHNFGVFLLTSIIIIMADYAVLSQDPISGLCPGTISRLCPNILLNLCVSYGRLWSAFPGTILGALPRHNFTALSTHYHGALPMPDYSLLSQEAIPISVLFSCTSSGLCRITTPGLWPNRCCKILDSELYKTI